MTILCHKKHRNIADFVKSVFLVCIIVLFCFPSVSFSKSTLEESKWSSLYNYGLELLVQDKLSESEDALSKALAFCKENDSNKAETFNALSLVLTARGIKVDRLEEAKLDQSRNTFLSGIVILILASFIASLLLRYGPQRPKAVENVENWIVKSKKNYDKEPTSQAVASMFSLLIFALATAVFFIIVMAFLWVLSMYNPPEDGHFEKSNPYYSQALEYLKKSDPENSQINQATAINNYYQFLKSKGKKKEALRLIIKRNKIEKRKKLD